MKMRCWSSIELGGAELPDGCVDVEHRVLVYGPQAKRGTDGKMREWEITPADAEQMAANFAADLAAGYEAPIFLGHPNDRSSALAIGWVKSVRAAEDGVRAVLRLLPRTVEAVRALELRYLSPTFALDWDDQQGRPVGAKLLDVGLLNTPHQKDLGPLVLAESAYQLSDADPAADVPARAETPEGDHMDETKLSELVAKAVAEYGATLRAELMDSIKPQATEPAAMAQLSSQIDALASQVIELKAVKHADPADEAKLVIELKSIVKEQGETLADLKRAKEHRDICDVIEDGIKAGTIELAEVPGFGTEKFDGCKWINESKWNGLRGLRMHVATAKPRTGADKRQTAPTTGAPAHELSEIPYSTKFFASREEFEKFAAAGSATVGR